MSEIYIHVHVPKKCNISNHGIALMTSYKKLHFDPCLQGFLGAVLTSLNFFTCTHTVSIYIYIKID